MAVTITGNTMAVTITGVTIMSGDHQPPRHSEDPKTIRRNKKYDYLFTGFYDWLLVTIKSVTYRYNSYIVSQLRWLHIQLGQLLTDISVTEKSKLQVTGMITVKVGYWWRR